MTTTYIALLRAVNVGGTDKLPIAKLKAMCSELGFVNVRTYIASGNVVFGSKASAAKVKSMLEATLKTYAGKAVDVLIRTQPEMTAVLANNPFPAAAPNRTVAIFLDTAPPVNTLETVAGRRNEQIAMGLREIYVHYGDGMATSKLRIPAATVGTARNMNTVAKLTALAR